MEPDFFDICTDPFNALKEAATIPNEQIYIKKLKHEPPTEDEPKIYFR